MPKPGAMGCAEAIRELQLNLEGFIQMQKWLAEIRWHSYQEHIQAGFTKEQALDLCKYTQIK